MDFKKDKKKNKRFAIEGLSFKKSFLILLVLLLQLATMILFYLSFVISFTTLYVISIVLSTLTSFRVLLNTKNPDAKASWILFLLLFPSFGFFIYFLAGGSDMHPIHKKKMNEVDKTTKYYTSYNDIKNLDLTVQENINYLYNTAGANAYQNTDIKYYGDTKGLFRDLLKDLKKAEKSIYLEFFIINSGQLFDLFLEILTQKADAGVDVRIIYDGFGGKDFMNSKLKSTFKKHNIKTYAFSPIKPIFSFFLNYRNHRKQVIIDNKITYLGGFNLSDEYANLIERFGHWKDSGMRLEGDASSYLALSFMTMWMYVSKEKINLDHFTNYKKYILEGKEKTVVPYLTGPNQSVSVARANYLNIINQARKSINIMTPYLVIDDAMSEILISKVLSGIEVNIIIPGIPDKKIVYMLSKSVAKRLVNSGCNIYAYTPGFIHSKILMVDNKYSVVGSINFDFRSFYQQYENAVYVIDEDFAKDIEKDFKNTIKESRLLKPKSKKDLSLFRRLFNYFLKWIAPLM